MVDTTSSPSPLAAIRRTIRAGIAEFLDLDAEVLAEDTASIVAWLPITTDPRHVVDLGYLCSDSAWRTANGDAGDAQCGTDWDGSEELSFVEQCQAGILTAADGCGSADTPQDDGPGSMYTNPQPGVDYGMTPEELQREGCELGYLTEGC